MASYNGVQYGTNNFLCSGCALETGVVQPTVRTRCWKLLPWTTASVSIVSHQSPSTQCHTYDYVMQLCHDKITSVTRRVVQLFNSCATPFRIGQCSSLCNIVVKMHWMQNAKGKGFPYSLPSIVPRADPGVQAVSPQVIKSSTGR